MPSSIADQPLNEARIRDILARYSPTLPVLVLALPVVFYVFFALIEPLREPFAFDLGINYSAATLLRTGSASIFDRDALRIVHKERIGSVIPYDDLYKGLFTTYINPPTTALLLVPFSLLPFWLARIAFLFFNNVLYLVSIYRIAGMFNAPWKTLEGVLVWTCALTFYPFVIASNWLGQIDGIILFFLTLSVSFTLRRRHLSAGVCIALASVAKISPLLVIGFFLARRKWSALLGLFAAVLLVAVLVITVAGSNDALQFGLTFLPLVSKGSAFFENQSLLGAIYHFLAAPAALSSLDTMRDLPLARLIWACLAIAFIGVVFWLVYRATLDQPPLVAVAFGAFVLLSVLLNGISWDHYMTWLLIPIIAVMLDWFQTRWLNARVFWPIFAVAVIGIVFPYPVQVLLFPVLGRGIISCGTYGMLFLLLLISVRLKRDDARYA